MSAGWWGDRDKRQGPPLESILDKPGRESRASQGGQEDMKSIAQAHAFISEKGIPRLLKQMKETSTSKVAKNHIAF